MKFIVSSAQLLKQLQLLNGVVNSSNTVPILDNILFEIQPGQLTLSASDMETTITTSMAIETSDTGSIALPARLLTDMLKTFAEQPLSFLVKEANQSVEISSDKGKYAIAYKAGSEFPKALEIEDPSSIKLPAYVLGNAIDKTVFATSQDNTHLVMTGVFLQANESELILVATDGHKLVKYEREDIKSEKPAEFILPKKPLNVLKGVLSNAEGDVNISYNEVNAVFSFENITLSSRLIDGTYPNYEVVIPKDNPNKLIVDRLSFLTAVRRMSHFSNKTTYQIRLKLAGSALQIFAEDIDFANKGEERLSCDYEGQDLEISFNSRFLSEMLSNLSAKDIVMSLSEPNKAGIVSPLDGAEEGERTTMLVMPVATKPNA